MNKLLRLKHCFLAFDPIIPASYNIRWYCVRKTKPIRCRTRRREDVFIGEVDAEQLKYKGGKKGQLVLKSGIGNALRGIGLSQRQFIEQDPLTEEDVDEFDNTIIHGENFYDKHNKEKVAWKNFIKKKQTIRKYFREPSETNLLTVAAKEQIRYLHNLDPVQWDAEKLSQSFPISIEGVKKLLRSRFIAQSSERKEKHDKAVANNIKLLKDGKEGISLITRKLWEEGKLKLEYSIGNSSLPMASDYTSKSLQLQMKQYPERVGQFLSIVKPYLDLKEKELSLNTSSQPTMHENQQNIKSENLWEVKVSPSPNYDSEDNSDDPLCASYLARKVNRSDPEVTFENIQQKTVNDSKTTNSNQEQTRKKSDGTKAEPVNPVSFISGIVPKYKDEKIELVVDRKYGTSHVEPYLYDSKYGYQHPLGESPDYPDKITIPDHLYKEGGKYKVGNCYYDDEGNFLYRTFA